MSSLALSDHDVRGLLDVVGLDRPWDQEGVPRELLEALFDLVRCDALTLSDQDTSHRQFFAVQEVPSLPTTVTNPPDAAAYWEHCWASSSCSRPDRTGDLKSVTLDSDVESQREYRNSPMYADHLRHLGVEHEMMLCLPAGGPQRTLRLLFARGQGPDVSERDRALLVLLRPHLVGAGHSNRMIARSTNLS